MHERSIELCECFQATGVAPLFPDATIVNGGAATASNVASRNHGATEVVIYGFTITTVGTNLQFYMPSTASGVSGGTPVAVTGMLFSTAALGTTIFPKPVRLRIAASGADANFSVGHSGASVATIYYRKLA